MLARRQERLPNQTHLTSLGRRASALALVAGLSGVSVAAAQPGPTASALGTTDSSRMLVQTDSAVQEMRSGMSNWESLRAIQTAGQAAFYEDAEAYEGDNVEEEEGQDDGIKDGGQAEQRAQGLYDKAEHRQEDHDN